MTSILARFIFLFIATVVTLSAQHLTFKVTHGPLVGRGGVDTMSVWMRTNVPGEVHVDYGLRPLQLDQRSASVRTELANDNTAVVTLTGLAPDTTYYYRTSAGKGGSFRTFPDPAHYRSADLNPDGLFNFQFHFTSCMSQSYKDGPGPDLPTFDALNAAWQDKVLFGITNGDFIYEEDRDYPLEAWRLQTQTSPADTPVELEVAPAIVGVWENYKTYLSRGSNLAEWYARVPNVFTFDDHELLNDIYGPGEVGYLNRRAVFRDQGVKAWWDYVGWANPMQHAARTRFGRAEFELGSDILHDPSADFTRLDLSDHGTLHVHWGRPDDGVVDMKLDQTEGDPNTGVYAITEIVDAHRLRIEPAARATTTSPYSIGRRSYGSFRVANCEFIILQTRSHRTLHDVRAPAKPDASILGKQQFDWLLDTIDRSTADFVFLISSVNFSIPHVGSGGGKDLNVVAKDDAWTVFLHEREQLIEHCIARSPQQFFVLTGDLHNSFAVKVAENLWEFGSGPANSVNHVPAKDEGGRPANGLFTYGPREVDIRWSTYVLGDIPRSQRHYPTFCIAQVNNVFNNPVDRGGERWVAFPRPHVIFKYFDGFTGELLYSESVHAK